MPNFSAKILNNAVSALAAQQAAIATTGTNIANVNTPGYARRQVEIETRATRGSGTGLEVGNGVQVSDVTRSVDKFLETLMQQSSGNKAQDELKNDYLQRVQELFNLTGDSPTIGSALSAFYSAINDVSLNPSSLELRSNVLQRGQDLVTVIGATYNTIADIQTELDNRLATEFTTVNGLTAQIADLNARVGQKEASGGTATDERDQRDVLVNKLSEKIGFKTIEVGNGMVNIFLDNGFPLVNGTTSRDITLTATPSFAGATVPPSLGGGTLRYAVYQYDPIGGTADLDLTQIFKAGNGTVGGILQLRGYNGVGQTSAFTADGDLVAVASRVEALTRQLLTTMNQTYRGPDENGGTAFSEASAGDLNGNTPGVFGLFDYTYTGAVAKDANANGLADLTDLTNVALGIDNFSSRLTFAVANAASFAAARDNNPVAGATTFPPGDAQNAQALAALRTQSFSLSVGNYSLNATLEDAYNETVTYVGSAKGAAEVSAKVSSDALIAASNRRDEISAVSLDEEFTDLITHQKAYQGSARMIRVAQELLDQLLNVI